MMNHAAERELNYVTYLLEYDKSGNLHQKSQSVIVCDSFDRKFNFLFVNLFYSDRQRDRKWDKRDI